MSEEQEVQEEVQPQDENVEVEETTTEEAPVEEAETTETTEEVAEEVEAPAEEVPEVKPVERKVHTMPVAKAQEEKRKAVAKAEEAVRKEFEVKADKPVVASDLDEVAKKHGLDPIAAKELSDAILAKVPKTDTSAFDNIVANDKIKAEKAQVADDFDSQVAPLILKDFPQATPQHIAKVKKEISELAFDSRYNTYQLTDIYTVTKPQHVFKNGLGAEAPAGKGQDMAKFKKLSDEEENKLADTNPELHAKYVNWEQGQASKFS